MIVRRVNIRRRHQLLRTDRNNTLSDFVIAEKLDRVGEPLAGCSRHVFGPDGQWAIDLHDFLAGIA